MMTVTTSVIDVAAVREREFSAAAETAYFNHASDSPMPARAARVIGERTALLTNPMLTVPSREEYLVCAQANLGTLMGAKPEQIAFLTNVSDTTAVIANGLDWSFGDEMVVVAGEFASFVYPWRALERFGVRVRIAGKRGVATALDDIEAAISDRTRVLAISHVQYLSGFRNDLAALAGICRERGVLFVVDASQSLGVLPIDAARIGIDAVVSVGYKWLMAPHGIGVLYVSRAAMERIKPTAPGRYSVKGGWQAVDYALDWWPDARRFQGGALNWIGVCALAESTGLLAEIGLPAVTADSKSVMDRMIERLAALPVTITSDLRPEHRSSILTFTFGSESLDEQFVAYAERASVILGRRAFGVRVGAHFWNDDSDLDRLTSAIEGFATANARAVR